MTPDIEKTARAVQRPQHDLARKNNRKTHWMKIFTIVVLQNSKIEKAAMENQNIFGILIQLYCVKE